MALTIATVVCAYNESRLLSGCLYSLRAQTRPPDEILVVNNASTDATGEVARAIPGIRVLEEPAKGLVVARETARLAARADIVAYMDADCRAPITWLSGSKRSSRRAGAAGGHRTVSLLRLGLERPRAHPRLRPRRRARHPCVRTSRPRDRRDSLWRKFRGAERRAGAHRRVRSADRVSRRRHEPGAAADHDRARRLVPRLLGLDLGAPLSGDGQGRGLPRLRAELLVRDPAASSGG